MCSQRQFLRKMWPIRLPFLLFAVCRVPLERNIFSSKFLSSKIGSEIWITTQRNMTRLEAAEMRFLRSVTWHTKLDKIRSEHIRQELEISEIPDVRTKYKQNWINHLERMDTPNSRNTPSPTNPGEEGIAGTPGNDGNASMPQQVKRPNAWKIMMMMMMMMELYRSNNSLSPHSSSMCAIPPTL